MPGWPRKNIELYKRPHKEETLLDSLGPAIPINMTGPFALTLLIWWHENGLQAKGLKANLPTDQY